jgi:hypothetical protein
MKLLALAILIGTVHAGAAQAKITELLWPLGENVCLGRWSYNEINLCEITDPDQPLYEGEITYPLINKTCRSWTFGEVHVESKEMSIGISDRSSIKNFEDVQSWCRYQAKATQSVDGVLNYWKDGQYNEDRVTQRWVLRDVRVDGNTGICRLDLVNQPEKQDTSCGAEPDLAHPSRAFSGYGKKTVYDAIACGFTSRSLEPFSSVATLKALDSTSKESLVCSTHDGEKLETEEEVQAKAILLNKELLAALGLDSSFCAFKMNLAEYTQLFVELKASKIPSSQQSILKSISRLVEKKCSNP